MCFEKEGETLRKKEKQPKSHLASGRYIYIYILYIENVGLLARLLTYLPTPFISFISTMNQRILVDF